MKKFFTPIIILTLVFSTVTSANVSDTQSQTRNENRNQNNGNKNQKSIIKANPACAQAAVEKRDSVIATALQKYTTDWISILNKRTDSQKLAFTKNQNERTNALKAANSVKQVETAKVQRVLIQSKKLAWDIFRVEIRACGFASNPLLED